MGDKRLKELRDPSWLACLFSSKARARKKQPLSLEERTTYVLASLSYTYAQCMQAQGHILGDPTCTAQQRYQYFRELAESFVYSGIPNLDRQELDLDANILQEVLWNMYCQTSAQENYDLIYYALSSRGVALTPNYARRNFFSFFTRIFRSRARTNASTPPAFFSPSHYSMSALPPVQRTRGVRAQGWRTGRGVSLRYNPRSVRNVPL